MTRHVNHAQVLLYGSNGYTGRLLLPHLLNQELRVVVAGRDATAVTQLAQTHGLEARIFSLDEPRAIDAMLHNVQLVVNAAGPFIHTAPQLIDACLRCRVDYTDLCGELDPLQYAASHDRIAQTLGTMLLPAIGFDVVPSDCLAAWLSRRLPAADTLTLYIAASNLLSRGSAQTLIENTGAWVNTRHRGRLEAQRFHAQQRWVDFGEGPRLTVGVSWGNLVTAFHTTGVPNIEVYFEATLFRWCAVMGNQYWGWALRDNPWLRAALTRLADVIPGGPTESARNTERCVLVAELHRGDQRVRARLTTPEAYTMTCHSAAAVARRIVNGERKPGFWTPAAVFGAQFVLGLPGVELEELGP